MSESARHYVLPNGRELVYWDSGGTDFPIKLLALEASEYVVNAPDCGPCKAAAWDLDA